MVFASAAGGPVIFELPINKSFKSNGTAPIGTASVGLSVCIIGIKPRVLISVSLKWPCICRIILGRVNRSAVFVTARTSCVVKEERVTSSVMPEVGVVLIGSLEYNGSNLNG